MHMEQALSLIASGGPVVTLLLIFSVVAVAVILIKLLQLWYLRGMYQPHLEQSIQCLERGYLTRAQVVAGPASNPRARIIHTGLHHLASPHAPPQAVRNELTRIANRGVRETSDYLRILEIIALIAPLLGLFGTVLGMIDAFRAMEAAGSQVDPGILSGGIWKALLTTAVGLAVAIPASLAHGGFERGVENLAQRLGDDIGRIMSTLEGLSTSEDTAGQKISKRDDR